MVLSEGTRNSLRMFLYWTKLSPPRKSPQVLVHHGSESPVRTSTRFIASDCDPSSQQHREIDINNPLWEGLNYMELDPRFIEPESLCLLTSSDLA